MKGRGILLVFLTAVVSGFAIFINKFGVTGINSSLYAFLKNAVVAVFLLSLLLLLKEFKTLKTLSRRHWLLLFIIGLLGGSIPFLLYFKGLQLTASSSAAFIHKTMFIYVLVLAAVFLREHIDKRVLLAAVIILLANALFLGLRWTGLNIGDLLIVAATILWATENTISKYTLRQLPSNIVAFGRMFFGSLFILLFLIVTGQLSQITTVTIAQLKWVFITSGLLMLYVVSWYAGLKEVKVSTATAILLLGSPLTALLSFIFLDSTITIWQAAGMLLLLVGIVAMIGYAQFLGSVKYILQNVRQRWN